MNIEDLTSNYYLQVAISFDAYGHFSYFFLLDYFILFFIFMMQVILIERLLEL